jgi:tetratricopeptide (TPR) repeat protein
LLQSLVDLPLQSPAVAGAAACCLGLAAGPGRPRRDVSVAIAGAVAVAGLLAFRGVPPTAEQAFQRAELAWAAGDADAARAGWLETLSIQPREAAAWLRLSGLARAEGDLEQASRLARLADRWEPFTMRTQWALAELELASGDAKAAVRRLAAIMQDAPDTRAAAIQALWRGGAELDLIEAEMARSDGGAAGDFLAFLARAGMKAELEGAYQRLVVERELRPAQAEAEYISRALADVSVGATGRPPKTR